MNISLLEPIGIPAEKIAEYGAVLEKVGHQFTYYENKTTDVEELKKRTIGQDIVIIANNPYPNEVVEAADRLKMISVAFTGIDHVGIKACREKGVMICNCAGYSDISVAELALGMTIELYRKLRACDSAVRNGLTSAGLMGTEIFGKTVGIVGCGRIGFRAAKLFRAFGAKVLVYARREKEEWKKEGLQFCGIEELLKESDIVSVHLPLNDTTRGFLSRDRIGMMKENAVLINCARGPVIDNAALAQALQEKKIAGAAIDVFDMEPPIPADYPLCGCENALLTPHVAFLTKEAMLRRAETAFGNVEAYLKEEPQNICE